METTTDKRGGFYFRARIGAERVVVIHPDGCANALLTSLPDKPIILIPGGKIEGHSLGAGPGLMIGIAPVPSNSKIPYYVNVKPDEEGKFTFERVPPGFYRVFRVTNLNGERGGPVGLSHHVLVEVKSEATTQIMIGGKGRSIVGKLEVENFLPHWPRDLQRLTSLTSNGLPPKRENFSNPSDYYDAWAAYDASIPKYFFGVTVAGTFKIDDVAPGKYKLQISFTDTPEDLSNPLLPHSKTIVLLTKEFEVPENMESSPIDLGVLPVPVR